MAAPANVTAAAAGRQGSLERLLKISEYKPVRNAVTSTIMTIASPRPAAAFSKRVRVSSEPTIQTMDRRDSLPLFCGWLGYCGDCQFRSLIMAFPQESQWRLRRRNFSAGCPAAALTADDVPRVSHLPPCKGRLQRVLQCLEPSLTPQRAKLATGRGPVISNRHTLLRGIPTDIGRRACVRGHDVGYFEFCPDSSSWTEAITQHCLLQQQNSDPRSRSL